MIKLPLSFGLIKRKRQWLVWVIANSRPKLVGLSGSAPPLPSARQHPSYGDCLEVKEEYYQNCLVLGCVTQCSQSAAHSYEQFLQADWVCHIGTLMPCIEAVVEWSKLVGLSGSAVAWAVLREFVRWTTWIVILSLSWHSHNSTISVVLNIRVVAVVVLFVVKLMFVKF